jgi:hypothetical protein
MSGVLPSRVTAIYVYVPNLLLYCNTEMHDRWDGMRKCSDFDVRWLLADTCR